MHNISITEDRALLDKISINGIMIKGFKDYDDLERRGIVENSKSILKYWVDDGNEFTRLRIKGDGIITKLSAGCAFLQNRFIRYCNMDITIGDEETSNLRCISVADYAERLEWIRQHLLEKYGIIADFSRVGFRMLEINRTFKLDGSFEDYYRVFHLLMTNLPSHLNNQMDWRSVREDGSSDFQTFYARTSRTTNSTHYLELKIYNKTKSVENIIVLHDSYMRFELKLVGSEKIKAEFGTNRFEFFSDERINDYFDSQVRKLIEEPYKKWADARDRHLVKLMKHNRKNDERHWQTNVLRILMNEEVSSGGRPSMLDINELLPLVDKLGIPNATRRYKIRKNFRNQCRKFEKVFQQRDDLKMQEILTKLQKRSGDVLTDDPTVSLSGDMEVSA